VVAPCYAEEVEERLQEPQMAEQSTGQRGGKQGQMRGWSPMGQQPSRWANNLLRWHSRSWGKAGEEPKRCQLLSICYPGPFGVAETVLDVMLFYLVLLGP